MRTIVWLWWCLFYAVKRQNSNLDYWLLRLDRTRAPWWKFRPGIFHNEPGRMWQICWSDDSCYAETVVLRCKVSISRETGKLVGLTLLDEQVNADYRGVTLADSNIARVNGISPPVNNGVTVSGTIRGISGQEKHGGI